jgi:hypothetical protein
MLFYLLQFIPTSNVIQTNRLTIKPRQSELLLNVIVLCLVYIRKYLPAHKEPLQDVFISVSGAVYRSFWITERFYRVFIADPQRGIKRKCMFHSRLSKFKGLSSSLGNNGVH